MDKVVAVVNHKYDIMIFMESGKIWRMTMSEFDFRIKFSLVGEVPSR